jgi:hypothetical protein
MRNALVLLGVGVAVAAAPDAARASAPDWSDPVDVAPGIGTAVGIDAEGEVTAAWHTFEPKAAFVATRQPGAVRFGAPVPLGGPGAASPNLAVNESGAAVLAWLEQATPCEGIPFDCAHRLGIRTRAPGADGFGPAVYVSEDALERPVVAMNEDGETVVAWPGKGGAVSAVLGSVRTGFGAPASLRPGAGQGFGPRVAAAIGESGAALVSWGTFGGPPMASYRPAGGSFGPAEVIVPIESVGTTAAVVDPRGTATVAVLTNERARLRIATRAPRGGFREFGPAGEDRVGGVALDHDASGNQLMYWTRQTSPEENSPRLLNQTFVSFRSAGEAWSEPIAVLAPNAYPILRLDRLGNAHALWTTGARDGQRVRGATFTRFGILERPQELGDVIGQADDMEVNRSGAAAGLFTEYITTDGPVRDSVVRLATRPADERPASVRVAVFTGATAARVRARCDEPCRLRARVGSTPATASARRAAVLTLRANRRGSLRVRLSRRARARLRAGRPVRLVLRASDGAGNVRRITRRLGR